MNDIGFVGLILIAVTLVVSYKGLKDNVFLANNKFDIDRILVHKEYKRLVTSGFLHLSWSHLFFNMFSLFAFSFSLESYLGSVYFLIIYFASLIGGNLLALFVHRNHGDYSAVGASGAVCGIIFASIALFPGIGIGFFILPFSIPGWLYGILYVAFTIYGIKSNKDSIGHEAHLGGALVGMLVSILLQPRALLENYVVILLIAVPTIVFILLIIKRPQILIIGGALTKPATPYFDIDHKYNEQKAIQQKEIDRILDKINRKGIKSLTKKEKEQLDAFSKK